MKQILITIDQPHWNEEDHDYLIERIQDVVYQEVPSDHFTVQEITK